LAGAGQPLERRQPVANDFDLVSFLAQGILDEPRDLALILDYHDVCHVWVSAFVVWVVRWSSRAGRRSWWTQDCSSATSVCGENTESARIRPTSTSCCQGDSGKRVERRCPARATRPVVPSNVETRAMMLSFRHRCRWLPGNAP